MTDAGWLKEELAGRKEKLEKFLTFLPDKLPDAPERLLEAMTYSLEAGGKRLRPALCMATAGMYGLEEEVVLPFAAAIEMIHTYSLIHDDLPAMDDDDLRRGKPSCHKKFDEATAILAGDALLTDAFWLAAAVEVKAGRVLAASRELALAAGSNGMAGGQMLDMLYTGKRNIGEKEIRHMQALKTGAMIKASAVCGALLAGAPPEEIARMVQYGKSLGCAFQIADDVLDLTATTEELGKPAGSDIAMQKNTFPALVGIEESLKIASYEAEKAARLMPDNPQGRFLAEIARYAVSRRA